MLSALWIAPNLNHYKVRFLSRLVDIGKLKVTVIAGAHVRGLGYSTTNKKGTFSIININATKNIFHIHPTVYIELLRLLFRKRFDVVLMPAEKKHLPVILYLFILKFFLRYRLVSYNHHMIISKKENSLDAKYSLSKLLFSLYDRIIFYTEQGKLWAVRKRLLPLHKAYFANNTLDTKQIWDNYIFEINMSEPKTILFIGRLVPNKRLDLLFEYYNYIKRKIPDLQLIVIGDGPMSSIVKKYLEADKNIHWRGAVIDEEEISEDMRRTHVVVVPGASGLAIVHSLCYGKPYITITSPSHGPEIVYLRDEVNGFLLRGGLQDDCDRIVDFLFDEKRYSEICRAAYATAQELAIENWCRQIQQAFVFGEK